MRSTIVTQYLAEREARPDATYSKIRDLATASAAEILEGDENQVSIDCPACGSSRKDLAFERAGYRYWECDICGTLYISPRPSVSSMTWYLLESPLAEFRNSSRHDAQIKDYTLGLVQARLDWTLSLANRLGNPSTAPIVVFQSRHKDFAAQIAKRVSSTVYEVMPLWDKDENSIDDSPGVQVLESLQDLTGSGARLLVAFDSLEHILDIWAFFEEARETLVPGGLLALTTRAASGFDIQALWDDLDTIFPLEHLNLISVDGMRILTENMGFNIVELSTPGQLDVQVVARVLAGQERASKENRALRRLVFGTDESGREDLQRLLQKHLMSSHLRMVAYRKGK